MRRRRRNEEKLILKYFIFVLGKTNIFPQFNPGPPNISIVLLPLMLSIHFFPIKSGFIVIIINVPHRNLAKIR
jgi:hypothetical protein